MKIKLEDISTSYYAEGGETLLGVSIKTTSGYSLYKPLNAEQTDWERLASSKNPIDFDKIIFGKPTAKTIKSKTIPAKSTKNNIEEVVPKETTTKTKQKGKETPSKDSKKVKKSFL